MDRLIIISSFKVWNIIQVQGKCTHFPQVNEQHLMVTTDCGSAANMKNKYTIKTVVTRNNIMDQLKGNSRLESLCIY